MRTLPTLVAAISAAALIAGCGSSTADSGASFPRNGATVEWVVPSAAGAGNNILARIMAPAMETELGVPVKVVNKEGGSQVVGLNYLANAKPDGETIGFTNIPSILGRYLDPSKKAGFDRESFSPIGSFASNDIVIGVNKSSPYKNIAELFDAVKANPGSITVGTDSRAGDDHVNLRTLEDTLGLDFNIVHYNSGADKISALVSGETDFALGGVSSFYGQFASGEVNILSVLTEEQNKLIPEVPTLASEGYDAPFMTNNFAISAPAGTPDATMTTLQNALETALADPAVAEKLTGAATQPDWVSGADVATLWEQRETEIEPIIAELLADQQ
ncbi:hypothetical protein CH278_05550 [Rhodococcus sp. 05-2254-5]|uniref:Bug family tripartite tricarboxylate transporter substrate binding protein n=1 Tax=unclassified Rhodococcus (in: high G+C Gram-positive bacteria) TaxID=192944 RepID=UPI000B9AC11C|nr:MULTISPECIES: tripartite tricarboxylate transporter substrate binding protein [unclassified Rhodococcus (in: high G+C Gram-positive bacteria)]OZE36366.1 hypothetical protein CH278_05550 [Rhodococcus sp. 05-2254-5]OZE62156.1 hypothetical protein CH269_02930 [Rhodococcus sp. 05-2254-1]